MASNLRQAGPAMLLLVILTGCLPLPPQGISLSEAPVISNTSCTFTIAREKHLLLALNTHYISLNGDFIASLDMSEYTMFAVPEGAHTLGVTWRVIDEDVIRYRVLGWRDLSKSINVDCEPPTSYLFTLSAGYPWYPEGTVLIDRVDEFEGDYALERKEYVPAGL